MLQKITIYTGAASWCNLSISFVVVVVLVVVDFFRSSRFVQHVRKVSSWSCSCYENSDTHLPNRGIKVKLIAQQVRRWSIQALHCSLTPTKWSCFVFTPQWLSFHCVGIESSDLAIRTHEIFLSLMILCDAFLQLAPHTRARVRTWTLDLTLDPKANFWTAPHDLAWRNT